MTRPRPVVAIDGPAGAGKSTVARTVADRLGYALVDTGALYRAVALAVKNAGVAFENTDGVARVADDLVARGRLRFFAEAGRERILLDGEDVGEAIRTPEMSTGASRVSAIPGVRKALFALQRQAGEHGGVVLEGRDIGTVVFPDAELKFYLTASAQVRAARRFEELRAKGQPVTLEATLEEVKSRDLHDSTRAVSPLRQAEDAVLIDSSDLTVDEVVAQIVRAVRAHEPA